MLFTGAGFSGAALAIDGEPVPSVRELKKALYELCYPSEEYDEEATLGELYQVALNRQRSRLSDLLQRKLSVRTESLPSFYEYYFDFPWLRYYSLNVDNLAIAAAQKFDLRRPIQVISATTSRSEIAGASKTHPLPLEAVHLNGMIADPPEHLTFSEDQYAKRISNRETWYSRLVADITSHPGVFVGTELREVPLWQHLELRRRASPAGRDLRPSSILVTPKLSASRRELLNELRLEWYEGTAQSFAEEILSELKAAASIGFEFLQKRVKFAGSVSIPLVSELLADQPTVETEYLMGEEPRWSDLLSDRAAERSHFTELVAAADAILASDNPGRVLAVTGTAGTGKSTALMRLALKLSAEGLPVLWVDKDSDAGIGRMRAQVREFGDKSLVLAVDDADLYGQAFSSLVSELAARPKLLCVFAMRSSKLDNISQTLSRTKEVELVEHAVPHLDDSDIDALIHTLDRHNRLGVLKGLTADERRKAFRTKAGRQLLVAMIEATSGEKFEEKVFSELDGLEGIQRTVYALVSVASAHRHYLTKDEVILASGDIGDQGLQALERLVARHLLVRTKKSRYRARHRVVADLVLVKLQETRELREVLAGLAFSVAAKLDPETRRDRHWRLLIHILSHSFLLRVVGIMDARAIYAELENVLSFDYHFWLQRGSLEVEAGDVKLGANFLNQARSLRPGDFRIETEYAYMLIRRAYESPRSPASEKDFTNALAILEDVILHRGKVDSYPYHVVGSQGLAWARRADLGARDKRELLTYLIETVKKGYDIHPKVKRLRTLLDDLQKEYLMTTVPSS